MQVHAFRSPLAVEGSGSILRHSFSGRRSAREDRGKGETVISYGSAARSFGVSLLILGLFLTGLAHVARGAPPTAGPLFVQPNGTGTACTQSVPCDLATALAKATDGSTLYLAGGTYTGTGAAVITVTASLTIYGGWDGASTGPVVREPQAYPSRIDGEMQRRGIYIAGDVTPTLEGLVIQRGNGTGLPCPFSSGGPPDGCGGGIFVDRAHPRILSNVITGNVAAVTTAGYPTGTTGYGGGIALYWADRAVLLGNRIVSNTGGLVGSGSGGGIMSQGGTDLQIQGNEILRNVATRRSGAGWGGGINLSYWTQARVEGNRIEGNEADQGAGLYQWFGGGTFLGNRLRGNRGNSTLYLGYSTARVEGNQLAENDGGIRILNGNGGGPTLVNNVVWMGAGGDGLSVSGFSLYPVTVTLLHNTLVGDGTGRGVYVASADVTLWMTNNLVVGFAVGVTRTDPAATLSVDHTLFWDNGDDGITGTAPVFGEPAFRNRAAGDLRIGYTSAARDAGIDVGVTTDFEGQVRPEGPAPDLGADEFHGWGLFLPTIRR